MITSLTYSVADAPLLNLFKHNDCWTLNEHRFISCWRLRVGDRVKQNWIKYGQDFKEKRIQIIRIKIQFLKLLIIHFKKITFRININLNRIYSINILYNSCTANLKNATTEEYQGLFHEELINGKEEVFGSIANVGIIIVFFLKQQNSSLVLISHPKQTKRCKTMSFVCSIPCISKPRVRGSNPLGAPIIEVFFRLQLVNPGFAVVLL